MEKSSSFIRILTTTNTGLTSFSLLLLRFTVGILLFVAGAGKVFGILGGYGMTMTLQFYGKMGFSAPLAYLSMFTELIGGLLIVLGLLTRFAAFAVTINMLVATIVSLPAGIMGPNGAQTPIIFTVMAICILVTGPMNYSLDSIFFRKGLK